MDSQAAVQRSGRNNMAAGVAPHGNRDIGADRPGDFEHAPVGLPAADVQPPGACEVAVEQHVGAVG